MWTLKQEKCTIGRFNTYILTEHEIKLATSSFIQYKQGTVFTCINPFFLQKLN